MQLPSLKSRLTLWLLSAAAALACVPTGAAPNRFAATEINRPEFFPILPWDPYHGWQAPARRHPLNGLDSIAQCNFNLAGFVLPRDLRQCEKLGLGALLNRRTAFGSLQDKVCSWPW